VAVKRTGAFRALLASHAQITRNRLARELGRFHFIVTVLVVAFVLGTSLLPIAGATFLLGFFAGGKIGLPASQAWVGALLFLLSVGGGLMSGGLGGTRQLAWETYRAYPLRHATLLAAELVASVVDLVPLFFTLVIGATVLGVLIALPRAAPLLLVVAVEAVLTMLAIRMIVASFAAAIVRRLRVAVTLVMLVVSSAPLLGTVPAAGVTNGPRGADVQELTRDAARAIVARKKLEEAATWLPSTQAVRGVALAIAGHPLDGVARQAYPVGFLLLALVLASKLVAREVSTGGIAPEGGTARTWSFRTPAIGIARLTWHTLVDSAIGRFGLIVPILTLVLVKWPLGQVLGWGASSTPAAYAYVALSTSAIQLNQFGLDGHGIKTLLLLPVSSADIFRGKSLGLGVFAAAQVGSLALLSALVQKAPLDETVAGALLGMSLALFQNMVGRWTSSWMPRRLPRRDMRSTSGPGALVLVAMGLTVGAASVLGAAYVACAVATPALLIPAMAAVFAAMLVAQHVTLASAVRYFEARRELVVHAIG